MHPFFCIHIKIPMEILLTFQQDNLQEEKFHPPILELQHWE